jgi:hypothetical protein
MKMDAFDMLGPPLFKFADHDDATLRDMARRTESTHVTDFTKWDRAMLLAFFHNRYRDGVVPPSLLE